MRLPGAVAKEVKVRAAVNCSHRRHGSSNGTSLIELIIAVGISAICIWGVAKVFENGISGTKFVRNRRDLESIKQMINADLDCSQTLAIVPGTPLPVSCANYSSVTLLKSSGEAIGAALPNGGNQIAQWTISTACINNQLVVSATAPGNDQLTGVPLSSTPSNSLGVKVSTDLFGGSTDFCREDFDSSFQNCQISDPNYPHLQLGTNVGGQPLCCRLVTSLTAIDPVVSCNTYEFGLDPSGICVGTGAVNGVQVITSDPAQLAWTISCYQWDGSAKARGIVAVYCCPK